MGNHIEITTEDLDWITWCVAQQVRVSSNPTTDKSIETLHNKLYSFQFQNPPEAKTYSLSKTTEELQEQLDVIESRTLFVSGYLHMLKQLGAIHPRFFAECDDHLNELGEVMDAVLKIKEELGLHSDLKKA